MQIKAEIEAGTFDLTADSRHMDEDFRSCLTAVLVDLEPQPLIMRIRVLPRGVLEITQAVAKDFEPIDDHGTLQKFHEKQIRLEVVRMDNKKDRFTMNGTACVVREPDASSELWSRLVMTVHPEVAA